MFSLETLEIDVNQFKDASYEAAYDLGDEYFEALDGATIQQGTLHAEASINKVGAGEYALTLKVSGAVTVQCDRCLEDMEQPIEAEDVYTVRLGHGEDEDDEVVMVDEQEGTLSLAWLVYETAALALPIKHIHAPGKCNDAMTRKLEELSATRSGDENEEAIVDPRWAELAKLKN